MLCKKAEITERKYKSHDSENFFETMSYQDSTKESLRGSLGNRNEAIRQLYKSEKKCNREMKSLKNKKKISIEWSSAPAHVVIRRRSRRYMLTFPRKMSTLAEVYLEVILSG